MYKELLFYLEACESGSIFANLLKAPKVKAVTAANPKESSWGYYCAPHDKVQGKSIGSCLGDEFSIHWMEDADAASANSETVKQQVDKVVSETKKSHVQQYGDDSLDSEAIGNFEGTSGALQLVRNAGLNDDGSAVSARDVEVHVAYYRVHRAQTLQEKIQAELELAALLEQRRMVDLKFYEVALAAAGGNSSKAEALIEDDSSQITRVTCHKAALAASEKYCGDFTDYSMRYSRLLVNLCESGLADHHVAAALHLGCENAASSCTGSADPPGAECYEGKAGALGVTETVKVSVKSFGSGKGTMDLSGSGIQSITCTGKSFTKTGQDLAVDLSDCLPEKVTISSVRYCSDSDSIRVTVKDSSVPIPISATLSKVPCASHETESGQIVV
jgi:hypothetical protein